MEKGIRTPAYIIDESAVNRNLLILKRVEEESGAFILLAEKAFSTYQCFPMIADVLSGTTSSGYCEARLAFEEFHPHDGSRREIHVFEPAYDARELDMICEMADHIVFNSISELARHGETIKRHDNIKYALRINPECSTQDGHAIYDPCARGSRLGIREDILRKAMAERYGGNLPDMISGIHFHTLCEQGFSDLNKTWEAVQKRFGDIISSDQITWINLGGGHHITKPGYDVCALIDLIKKIRAEYGVDVYLEPGEAVVLNAGSLITKIMDIVETDLYPVLILDTSAACHMPDVLEMPYTPPLDGAVPLSSLIKDGRDISDIKEAGFHVYRLSSRTCLSGDVIGDYSFRHEMSVGDILEFRDMALYTMVKTNTFNGMFLPDIVIKHTDGQYETVKTFGYDDFKSRL